MYKNFFAASALLIMLFLQGCQSPSQTEKFYTQISTMTFPKRPSGEFVPWGSQVDLKSEELIHLGILSFKSSYGREFVKKSIQHNARKIGADFFVLRNSHTTSEQQSYYVPGYTTHQTQTTYHQGQVNSSIDVHNNSGGYASGYGNTDYSGTSTTSVPVYTPGYTGVKNVSWQHVTIDFYKDLSWDKIYSTGMINQWLPNGTCIVGNLLEASPAFMGGLRQGDILVTYNGLKVEGEISTEDELDSAIKARRFGPEIRTIQVRRNGKMMSFDLTPRNRRDLLRSSMEPFRRAWKNIE